MAGAYVHTLAGAAGVAGAWFIRTLLTNVTVVLGADSRQQQHSNHLHLPDMCDFEITHGYCTRMLIITARRSYASAVLGS